MKKQFIITLIILGFMNLNAATPEEIVSQAKKLQQANDLVNAVEILNQGLQENTESADILALLGFYKGMQAGQTENYIEAGQLVEVSFDYLDKAVEMDTQNLETRLYRGIIGVSVPAFFGRMDQAVGDLNIIIEMKRKHPDHIPNSLFIAASSQLAQAYEKQGYPEKAHAVLQTMIELAPESAEAQKAKKELAPEQEKSVESSENTQKKIKGDIYQKTQTLYEKGQYEKAVQLLKDHIEDHPEDVNAIYLLLQGIGNLANAGYDASISEDTNTRANLAMDAMYWMDRAVKLDSGNLEIRIQRDATGIEMPFFVGKLESSIEDLEKILESGISGKIKAEALYWLGKGHQKKAMKYWNEVITKYSGQEVAADIRDAMRPPIHKFDIASLEKPAVVVDFVLSYQDQLSPQTAIWVETEKGEYVATIYVSGFSGHVKGKQVVLPKWAAASDFKGLDTVTAASIDLGEHIYIWDLKDFEGKDVKKGNYRIHVEVSHWPSMEYQTEVMSIQIGGKDNQTIANAGNCLSYCDARYITVKK